MSVLGERGVGTGFVCGAGCTDEWGTERQGVAPIPTTRRGRYLSISPPLLPSVSRHAFGADPCQLSAGSKLKLDPDVSTLGIATSAAGCENAWMRLRPSSLAV